MNHLLGSLVLMAGCTMASDHKPLDICQSTTDPEIIARASLTPIQNESVVYIGTAFTYRVNYGSGEVFLERME